LGRDDRRAADGVVAGRVADQRPVAVAGPLEAVVALGPDRTGREVAVVDDPVAVVVLPVADLGRQRAAGGAATPVRRVPFVDLSVAVVVQAVLQLGRAVTWARRLVVRVVRIVGAVRKPGAGGDGVAGHALAAGVRHTLVDQRVAVLVLAVAELRRRDVLRDDVHQRRPHGVGVGQRHEDGLAGPAGRRDLVGGRLLRGREAAVGQDVGLDALGDDRRVVHRAGRNLG